MGRTALAESERATTILCLGERRRRKIKEMEDRNEKKEQIRANYMFLVSWNVFSAWMHLAAFAQNVINEIKLHKTW